MLKKINTYPIILSAVFLIGLVVFNQIQAIEKTNNKSDDDEAFENPCISQKKVWAGKDEPIEYLKPKEHKNIFIYNEQTVVDKINKLEWKICPEGQQLLEGRCASSPTLISWDQSFNLVSGHSYANKNDWRMPTIYELETIIDNCSMDNDYFNDDVFPTSEPGIYWSSSEDAGFFSENVAWAVDFGTSVSSFMNKDRLGRVRAVRNIK